MSSRQLEMIFKTTKTGMGEKQAVDGLKDVKQGAAGALQELTGLSVGTMGVAGVMVGLAAALGSAVRGAMEAETITADLNATIKSTKGIAGLTADEIQNMAQEFSDLTGIEDDSIVKAQSLLLTFTSVGKDVFPDATEAILNMSSKMGGLESATVMIGKALNVTAGDVSAASMAMSALKRVGVAFTTDQVAMGKALVETGDVMGYQKLILGELNTEFGGLAEAMGNTTQGKINKAKNALGNLGETIGGILLPFLGSAAEALTILIKGIDELVNRSINQRKEIENTSDSYEEYIARLNEAYPSTTKVNEAMATQYGAAGNVEDATSRLIRTQGALTEEQWKSTRAFEANNKQLEEAPPRFDDYIESTEELTISLDDEKNKLAAVNTLMKSYTTELLFNQAAAGLDSDATLVLMASLGLIDESTQKAMEQLKKLRGDFDDGKLSALDYANKVADLNAEIEQLKDKTVKIQVNTYKNTYTGNYVDPGTGSGFANGADFIVPPGYPNDSFRMNVQSGEHVVVTPANQVTNNTGGSITFSGPVYMNSAQDIDILAGKLTAYWQRQGR